MYLFEDYKVLVDTTDDVNNKFYITEYQNNNYDLLFNTTEDSHDVGLTAYKKGTLSGTIWNDVNYNGTKDTNEATIPNITLEVKQYYIKDNKLVFNTTSNVVTNNVGKYLVNVDTYVTIDGTKYLTAYTINLKSMPNGYTATKYETDNHLILSDLSVIDTSQVDFDNKAYIIAIQGDENVNDDYTFHIGEKTYDITKGYEKANLNIGLLQYHKGTIKGNIFEDINYDGLNNDNSYVSNATVTLKQYYYDGTNWIETTTTISGNCNSDGNYEINNIPTFVEVENVKYLAGYKAFISFDENTYAITRYQQNNGTNDSSIISSNYEITKGTELDGLLIVASQKEDKSQEPKYDNFDIVESIVIENYDGGLIKYTHNGTIKGTIFEDINYDGLMNDDSYLKDIEIILEQYKLVNGKFEFVKELETTTTNITGEYEFTSLPTFIVENNERIPVSYKLKVKVLPEGYTITKYRIEDTTYSNSDLVFDNHYLVAKDEFIIITKETTDVENPKYKFTYENVSYDLVETTTRSGFDGGMKAYEFGSISGNIFEDIDYNGLKDSTDKNLNDIRITLTQHYKDRNDWKVKGTQITTTDTNGNYSFNNLPTFITIDGTNYLAGYTLNITTELNNYAVTKYLVNGTPNSAIISATKKISKPNEEFENYIIIAKPFVESEKDILNEKYELFDIVEAIEVKDYDGGFTKYAQASIIKGIIFNDDNYNGLLDLNEVGFENIEIILEQYKLVNGKFELVKELETTTTNASGEYIFTDLPTFITEGEERIPVSYKLKVKEIPNGYTITKYRINDNTLANSDLIFDSHYLVAEDEFIIIAKEASLVSNKDYEFTYDGITYDLVESTIKDGFDGGIKAYEFGSIEGIVWEDTNYDGLMNNNEFGINDVELTLTQSYKKANEWIVIDTNITTTNTNGEYILTDLPTFVTIDGNKYLAGYTLKVTTPMNDYAATKYLVNGTPNSKAIADTNEINNSNKEFEDYIVIAKPYDESNKDLIHEKYENFDIVEANNIKNYDGGFTKYVHNGIIEGIIFDDANYDGLMNDGLYLSNVSITLEQYKLVDNKFVLIGDYSSTTTNNQGKYEFSSLPTFVVENDVRVPVSYKLKVDALPKGYTITKYRINDTTYSNSDLIFNNNYLVAEDEFIILSKEANEVHNSTYEFTYENVIYDLVESTIKDGFDGGMKAYEFGSIEGIVWEDTNYDGLMNNNEFAINDVEITLTQSYKKANEWIVFDTKTTTTNTSGEYIFDKLPTFVIVDGNKYLTGYTLQVTTPMNDYAATKYLVNGTPNSKAIADTNEINNSNEEFEDYIIIAKPFVESEKDILHEKYELFDIVEAIKVKDYNGGFTKYVHNGIIEGIIFDDGNYNGLFDKVDDNGEILEKGLKDIQITLEQYKLVNDEFVFITNYATTITNDDGLYKFTSLPTFVVENDVRIPVAYKVKVDALPNGYTVTKYRIENNTLTNSDLIFDNHYLVTEDEFIIIAKKSNEVHNKAYEFTYKNVVYDLVETTTKDGFDGGMKAYEFGSIEGLIWEDINYNGLKEDNENKLSNIEITLTQYYKNANEWKVNSTQTITTNTNGEYIFKDLPTFVIVDDNKYLTGYTLFVTSDMSDYAATKYLVNGTPNSKVIADTNEINNSNEEFEDYIIIAKPFVESEKDILHEKYELFDIVEANNIKNYDGGYTKYVHNGIIEGIIFDDANYDGLMNDDLYLSDVSITLEQYKLVNNKFVLISNYLTTTTNTNGEFKFENLPTFIVENDERVPVAYKVKVDALPNGYTITKYRIEDTTYSNSDLIFDSHYLVTEDEFIIISKEANEVHNKAYEFTYENVVYDLVETTTKDGFDGGMKAYEFGSISNVIWEDKNYDGLMNNDEVGIKDVEIKLTQYYLNDALEWVATDFVLTTKTDENGLYTFENLPTFVEKSYGLSFADENLENEPTEPTNDGTTTQKLLAGYKLNITSDMSEYAATKYLVEGSINSAIIADTNEINKPTTEFEDYIIVAKAFDEQDKDILKELIANFDIVEAIEIKDYNGGYTKYVHNGIIEGIIFDDANYNGLFDKEATNGEKAEIGLKDVEIILEQYKLENDKFVLVEDFDSKTTTNEEGKYEFTSLPTFIIENEVRVPVSYKLKVKALPEGYTVTKYRIESNTLANSDLIFDSHYLVAEDEFIIIAKEANEVHNKAYEFTYENVVYDLVETTTKDGFDGGMKAYEFGSIEGLIWEDADYNGLREASEKKLSNIEITLTQYYKDANSWKETKETKTTKTNEDGTYKFEEVPTFVTIEGVNYLAGYTVTLTNLDTKYGITKYLKNKGINDSAIVNKTKEINKPDEEFEDYIIVAKKFEEKDKDILHEKYEIFDIVQSTQVTLYDGGLIEATALLGSIQGTIWNDNDENGLMNENTGIKDLTIILEQYKLVNGNFTLVKEMETLTNDKGEYIFNELPTFVIEGDEKLPTGYKIKLKELPNDYLVTKYKVQGALRNSKLIEETLYLTEDYIIIAGPSTNENEDYEFTYGGEEYDFLIAVESKDNDGGIYERKDIVQSGDDTKYWIYLILMLISLYGMMQTKPNKKDKKKKD